MLDGTFFAISKLDLRSFDADARELSANRAGLLFLFRAHAGRFTADCARLYRLPFALARLAAAPFARFRFQRLTVPLRVAEMKVKRSGRLRS